MLSRAKPAVAPTTQSVDTSAEKNKTPQLDTFIANRDFLGALTVLEVKFIN